MNLNDARADLINALAQYGAPAPEEFLAQFEREVIAESQRRAREHEKALKR